MMVASVIQWYFGASSSLGIMMDDDVTMPISMSGL